MGAGPPLVGLNWSHCKEQANLGKGQKEFPSEEAKSTLSVLFLLPDPQGFLQLLKFIFSCKWLLYELLNRVSFVQRSVLQNVFMFLSQSSCFCPPGDAGHKCLWSLGLGAEEVLTFGGEWGPRMLLHRAAMHRTAHYPQEEVILLQLFLFSH